jgi:hypothetical protein
MNPYTSTQQEQRRVINTTQSVLSDSTTTANKNAHSRRSDHMSTPYINDVDAMNDNDHDAMIEEYCMEDDENEHPPDNEYNSFFDEEYENIVPPATTQIQNNEIAKRTCNTTATAIANTTIELVSRNYHSHAISTTFREEDNTDIDDDDTDAIATIKRNEKFKVRQPKQDLYKFERYVHQLECRTFQEASFALSY